LRGYILIDPDLLKLPAKNISYSPLKTASLRSTKACSILGMSKEEMIEKVNVNGSAIAYGHPIGATGARIVMTLAYELRRRGGGYGVCGICSGHAQGDAMLIKVEP
jgi:acetyl-CoA C-acetyltransferase